MNLARVPFAKRGTGAARPTSATPRSQTPVWERASFETLFRVSPFPNRSLGSRGRAARPRSAFTFREMITTRASANGSPPVHTLQGRVCFAREAGAGDAGGEFA